MHNALDTLDAGTVIGSVLSSGGVLYLRGGSAVDATVLEGGIVAVEQSQDDGTPGALGTVVSSGGRLEVGPAFDVLSGSTPGVSVSAVISSGGLEQVYADGVAISTTVLNGGTEQVEGTYQDETPTYGSGVASGTVVSSGGTQTVLTQGVASGSVVEAGGLLVVSAFSYAARSSFPAGATIGAVVSSGGSELVLSGTASGTTVLAGGLQSVFAGGTASGTLLSGGTEQTSSGGSTVGATVLAGGVEFVAGTASGTVLRGGQEIVESGGTASGTVVSAGGLDTVLLGGVTNGSLIVGGSETVYGTLNGATISAGVLELAAPAAANSGIISFAPGGTGTLLIDKGDAPQATLAGFDIGDTIDLGSVGLETTATPGTSGANTSYTFSGPGATPVTLAFASAIPTGDVFQFASDGVGGTDVTLIKLQPPTLTSTATIGDTAGEQTAASSTVTATAANDAPTIALTGPALGLSAKGPILEFAGVTITDPDVGAKDSLTIKLSGGDAGGTLSGHGLTKAGAGTYTLAAASPATLTAELRGVAFNPIVPNAGTANTTFTLTASQAGASTSFAGLNAVVGNNGAISVSGATIGGSTILLGNGNDAVTLSGGDNAVLLGNGNDTVSGGSGGSNFLLLGNGNETVTLGGNGNTVAAGNGADVVKLTGSGNNVALGDGKDAVTLSGSGNNVVLGAGSDTVNGASGDTILISGTTLGLTGGHGETVFFAGGPASLDDLSSNTAAVLNKLTPGGAFSISDVAKDPGFMLDLKDGVGGYTSVAAVESALHSDGHGGTLLTVGSGGSAIRVDFVSTQQSVLTPNHFAIG